MQKQTSKIDSSIKSWNRYTVWKLVSSGVSYENSGGRWNPYIYICKVHVYPNESLGMTEVTSVQKSFFQDITKGQIGKHGQAVAAFLRRQDVLTRSQVWKGPQAW